MERRSPRMASRWSRVSEFEWCRDMAREPWSRPAPQPCGAVRSVLSLIPVCALFAISRSHPKFFSVQRTDGQRPRERVREFVRGTRREPRFGGRGTAVKCVEQRPDPSPQDALQQRGGRGLSGGRGGVPDPGLWKHNRHLHVAVAVGNSFRPRCHRAGGIPLYLQMERIRRTRCRGSGGASDTKAARSTRPGRVDRRTFEHLSTTAT